MFQSPQRGLFISYFEMKKNLVIALLEFQSPQRGLFISYRRYADLKMSRWKNNLRFSPLNGDCLFLTWFDQVKLFYYIPKFQSPHGDWMLFFSRK